MKKIAGVFLCVWFLGLGPGIGLSGADGDGIGKSYKGREPVKVYLGEFTNAAGQGIISPEGYKKDLEANLLDRKSLRFAIVKSPGESDLRISGTIKGYQYLDRGPLKVTPSPSGILLDAAASATANYAEIEVEYTVVDTKSAATVWKDAVSVYLKKKMTPEESVPLIYDKASRGFITQCFGKPK